MFFAGSWRGWSCDFRESKLDTAEDILLECIDWKKWDVARLSLRKDFRIHIFSDSVPRISLPQNMKTVAALIIEQWIVSVAKNVLNSRVLKLPAGAPEARSKMPRQPPSFLDTTWCNDPLALHEQVPLCWNSHVTYVSPAPIEIYSQQYDIWYVLDASAMLKTCCKSPHAPNTPFFATPQCQTWMDEVLLPLLGGKLENLHQGETQNREICLQIDESLDITTSVDG